MQTSNEYGLAALALFVIYVLIKEVVAPLVKRRNGNGERRLLDAQILDAVKAMSLAQHETIKILREMRGDVTVLRDWHKPDDKGTQPWKGQHIIDLMQLLPVRIAVEMKKMGI